MEYLLSLSGNAAVFPDNKLMFALFDVLSKGIAACQPEVLKCMVRALSGISEVSAMDELVEHENGAILYLLKKNFLVMRENANFEALDDALEMLHIISEASQAARVMLISLVPTLLSFIIEASSRWPFSVILESSKLLNVLVEGCEDIPSSIRNTSEYKNFIQRFGSWLCAAGDYELQATIMEALFRIVTDDVKMNLTTKWFAAKGTQDAFIKIRNEDFETDCRKFLNILNSEKAQEQRVFSYAAMCMSLGRYQMQKPQDGKLSELWIDFNTGSKSISAFVNDDSAEEVNAEWEMIVIKTEVVKDFRVNVSEDKTVLILKLNQPACRLAPFCPDAPEHYVKIVFDNKCNVSVGIKRLFGEVKYVSLPLSSPSISSTPSRILHHRASVAMSPLGVCSYSPQHSNAGSPVKSKPDSFTKLKQENRYSSRTPVQVSDETVTSSSGAFGDDPEQKEVLPTKLSTVSSESVVPVSNCVKDDERPARISPCDEKPAFQDRRPGFCEEANQQAFSGSMGADAVVPETQDLESANNDKRVLADTVAPQVRSGMVADAATMNDDVSARGAVNDPADIDAPVHFQIEETSVENTSKTKKDGRKAAKKLLTSTFELFQDSPDEAYAAVPVRAVEKKKLSSARIADASKVGAKVKACMSSREGLAAFDFQDFQSVDEKKRAAGVKASPTTQSTAQECKLAPAVQPENAQSKSCQKKKGQRGGKATVDPAPQRSMRSRARPVSYKEKDSDDEAETNREKPKSSMKKKNESSKGRLNKSVLFVSPVEETCYFNKASQQSDVLEGGLQVRHVDSEKQMTDVVQAETGTGVKYAFDDFSDDIEVKRFEAAMLKSEKQEMVEKWAKDVSASKSKTLGDPDLLVGKDSSSSQNPSSPSLKASLNLGSSTSVGDIRSRKRYRPDKDVPPDPIGNPSKRLRGDKNSRAQSSSSSFEKQRKFGWGATNKAENSQVFEFSEDIDEKTPSKGKKGLNSDPCDRSWLYPSKKVTAFYGAVKKKGTIRNGVEIAKTKEKKSERKRELPRQTEPTTSDWKSRTKSSRDFENEAEANRFQENGRSASREKEKCGRQKGTQKSGGWSKLSEVLPSDMEAEVSSPVQSKKIRSEIRLEASRKTKVEKAKGEGVSLEVGEHAPSSDDRAAHAPIKRATDAAKRFDSKQSFTNDAAGALESDVSSCHETPSSNALYDSKKRPWMQSSSEAFENIDKLTSKQQVRKKLWKSPVVIVNEILEEPVSKLVSIPSPVCYPVQPATGCVSKSRKETPHPAKQRGKKPALSPATPLLPSSADSESPSTVSCGKTDDVDVGRFAKFCQTILNNSHKKVALVDLDEAPAKDSPTLMTPLVSTISKSIGSAALRSNYRRRSRLSEVKSEDGDDLEGSILTCSQQSGSVVAQPSSPGAKPQAEKLYQDASPDTSFVNVIGSDKTGKTFSSEKSPTVRVPPSIVESAKSRTKQDSLQIARERIEDDDDDEESREGDISTITDEPDRDSKDIQQLVKTFGKNFSKSLQRKKSLMENFVKDVAKTTEKLLMSAWEDQLSMRRSVDDIFEETCAKELESWLDEKQKGEQQILEALSQLQNAIVAQGEEEKKRIKRLKRLHVTYSEEKRELQGREQQVQEAVLMQVKQNIRNLRRDMLDSARTQDIGSVRRALQVMLSKVSD